MLNPNKLYCTDKSSDYRFKITKIGNNRLEYLVLLHTEDNRYRTTDRDTMGFLGFSRQLEEAEDLSEIVIIQ